MPTTLCIPSSFADLDDEGLNEEEQVVFKGPNLPGLQGSRVTDFSETRRLYWLSSKKCGIGLSKCNVLCRPKVFPQGQPAQKPLACMKFGDQSLHAVCLPLQSLERLKVFEEAPALQQSEIDFFKSMPADLALVDDDMVLPSWTYFFLQSPE